MSNDKSQDSNTPTNFETPKKWWRLKSKLKNIGYATVVAATLVWSPSCNNGSNWNTSPEQETTEVVAKQPRFTWDDIFDRTITPNVDGVNWIILCENPETKQLFLSDGESKLTEDFDDIKEVWWFDGMLYYVWVNGWKCTILNEKWDTIISWLDEIEEYTIHNWDFAVSGKKNWESCLIFNGKVIDKWREYRIYINNDTDTKNWIYAQAINYVGNNEIISTFINGEKVWPDFSYEYYEDWAYNWGSWVQDYGETHIIVSYDDANNSPHSWTLIYNCKTIWTNLKQIGKINENSNVISYMKNWKRYILLPNWKECSIIYMTPTVTYGESSDEDLDFRAKNFYILVSDWSKSYLFDWELHELEWDYQYFVKSWKTPDWKFYFIWWNDAWVTFELDWKKIWTLEHITWVWTTKDWTLYLRWVETKYWGRASFSKKNVIYINWTVREDLNPDNDPQEWLHIDDNYN